MYWRGIVIEVRNKKVYVLPFEEPLQSMRASLVDVAPGPDDLCHQEKRAFTPVCLHEEAIKATLCTSTSEAVINFIEQGVPRDISRLMSTAQ